ncbi:MAG: hypothetical protein RMK81_17050, partial [Geminicoccaceae bacterium]|nr:hypothetical protein [Geminicoccaceae bacterium]
MTEAIVMHLLPTLNQVVSDWRTIVLVCLALLLWSWVSGFLLSNAGRKIRAALARASERLSVEPEQTVVAERFEALRRDLAEEVVIGPAWRAFAEAVVVPTEAGRAVRATIAPDQLFDLGLYRRIGADLRYHAALPGLLVGTGLLFTFFGLAIALANAGAIVTAADQAQRSASLEGLLNAASIKFWTSLVGLLCSILYAVHRKRSIKKTELALDRFCALLEARVPLATPAFLQAEANRTLEAQSQKLDTLANDLAQSIGPKLDEALDSRLGEHIGPLRAAIERLAAREAEGLSNTLETMLERFLAKLDSTGGRQLEEVGARLDQAAGGLAAMRESLDQAGSKLAAAAEALSERLREGSRAAAAELAEQMQTLSDRLAAVAEDAAKLLSSASNDTGETIRKSAAEAGKVLEAQADAAAAEMAAYEFRP